MDADMSTRAILLFNEPYHEEWAATVDGKPVGIVVANACMMAIEVPSGSHRVEFRRAPGLQAFRLSVIPSCILIMCAIGLCLVSVGRSFFIRKRG